MELLLNTGAGGLGLALLMLSVPLLLHMVTRALRGAIPGWSIPVTLALLAAEIWALHDARVLTQAIATASPGSRYPLMAIGYASLAASIVAGVAAASGISALAALASGAAQALRRRAMAPLSAGRARAAAAVGALGIAGAAAYEAASGGARLRALLEMGAFLPALGLVIVAGIAANTLAALATSGRAEEVRGALGAAALGMLSPLLLAGGARIWGDVLLFDALATASAEPASSLGASVAAAMTWRLHAIELGKIAAALVGLSALPAVVGSDEGFFKGLKPLHLLPALGLIFPALATGPLIDALRPIQGALNPGRVYAEGLPTTAGLDDRAPESLWVPIFQPFGACRITPEGSGWAGEHLPSLPSYDDARPGECPAARAPLTPPLSEAPLLLVAPANTSARQIAGTAWGRGDSASLSILLEDASPPAALSGGIFLRPQLQLTWWRPEALSSLDDDVIRWVEGAPTPALRSGALVVQIPSAGWTLQDLTRRCVDVLAAGGRCGVAAPGATPSMPPAGEPGPGDEGTPDP